MQPTLSVEPPEWYQSDHWWCVGAVCCPQVFIASMPFLRTLLSGADGSVTVPRGSQLVAEVPASSRGGEMDVGGGDTGELSDPVIGAVLRDLLARAGGSQERTAGEAMEMLLAIATTTRLGPVPVARITLGDNSSGAKWRPLVARVRIMERLLCDFGLSTPSGLEVGPIMALAADALNNASVKVRGRTHLWGSCVCTAPLTA